MISQYFLSVAVKIQFQGNYFLSLVQLFHRIADASNSMLNLFDIFFVLHL